MGKCRQIRVRVADVFSDTAVRSRTATHASHPFLVSLVVEVGPVVRDHDQQRQTVVGRSPQRRPAHQVVAVAENGNRHASGARQGERGAHGQPWA